MKRILFLVISLVVVWSNALFAKDIKIYLGPNSMFFSDAVGIGASIGADIEIGFSKFAPSDKLSILPEFSFAFSQTESSYFSYLGLKFFYLYNTLIFSFEKNNNVFVKFGLGTGISFLNVSFRSINFSSIGVSLEPLVGISYNFSGNLWVGFETRYMLSSDINNRITPIASPIVFIPFMVEF